MENQAKQIEEMQIKKCKMEETVVMNESRQPKLNFTAKYNSRRSLHCKRHQSRSVENFAPSPLVQDMDKTVRTKFKRTKHNGEDECRIEVVGNEGELKNAANEVWTHSSEGANNLSVGLTEAGSI